MYSLETMLIALLALFYVLGKSADLAIYNLRLVAERLGIRVFFLGLIIGLLTSLPEFAIGVNAILDGVPTLSLGNLLGGILVLFGLILGINIILQRKIRTGEPTWRVGLVALFLITPVLLGLDGTISALEGAGLIGGYLALLSALYLTQRRTAPAPRRTPKNNLGKRLILSITGIVLVLVIAHFAVELATHMLSMLPLSNFIVGVIIFSIGTNFPEIIVALRAWKNNIAELSLSNLLGSGMANILFVGVLAMTHPFQLAIDRSYYILLVAMVLLFALFIFFYRTDGALKKSEGFALVGLYLAFVALQLLLAGPSAEAAMLF